MVRPSAELTKALAPYVCVRVTDMRNVDLGRYRFDYDLTLSILLMHPDGTVYHRYGGRPNRDPLAWTSIDGLIDLLGDTLEDHAAHSASPSPPRRGTPTTIEDEPAFDTRGNQDGCVHCHTIHDVRIAGARQRGVFSRDAIWVWPEPDRVGLTMDAGDQRVIATVRPDSPAARAKLEPGDRIVRFDDVAPRTITDLQSVLDHTSASDATIEVEIERSSELEVTTLELAAGWKRSSPARFAWRPIKWNLSPAPGFGGPELSAAQKRTFELPADSFAFRIRYLVDWGRDAHRGRNARAAGLRKGDIVFSIDGKSDFESIHHFHSWVRLTKSPGDELAIRTIRGGAKKTVTLRLVE